VENLARVRRLRAVAGTIALTGPSGIGESAAFAAVRSWFSMTHLGEKALHPPAPGAVAPGLDTGLHTLDHTMDRYARGQDDAFEELYRLAAPRVQSFLLRLCGDLALAEDLAQETLLRVSRARGSFETGAAALPWIFAIGRNAFFDHRRRVRARREVGARRDSSDASLAPAHLADPDSRGDEVLAARELLDVVKKALDELPLAQREAFVLLRFEGMSVAQAASVLGTTEGSVKIRAFRAYEALRHAIAASEDTRTKSGKAQGDAKGARDAR
jgi:RNA polymerase sigma-70 factor (ECF subfamily)